MSLNKVILIGNVGKDPDVRYFDSGNAVANFPLATNERGYKLANGTEIPERTEWHNIVANRDRAQFVERYVKKGSMVYVEGKIRTRSYDDQSGIKRYVTEILADRIEFFSSGRRPQEGDLPVQTQIAASTQIPPDPTMPSGTDEIDDLPF